MKIIRIAKWLLFQAILLIILLGIIETALRVKGFMPGNIQPAWSNFKTVDSLIEIPHFISDSNGLLIANRNYFKHINNWGFRFNKEQLQLSSKKKIMLIGDSFTWGMSAEPQDSCFADILNKNEALNIFNFGIPIADPLQYQTIASIYADSIHPDMVVVVFYTGNDVMLHDRDIRLSPFYYYTNAGALLALDGNKFLPSAEAAYKYYAFEKYRITKPGNLFEKIAARSALAARLLAISLQWKEKNDKDNAIKSMSISKKYLYAIQQQCLKQNIPFAIALIPEYKELAFYRTPFKAKYKALLQDKTLGQHCFVPNLNSSMYYPYPDAHFNNQGHRAFADFLQKILLQP